MPHEKPRHIRLHRSWGTPAVTERISMTSQRRLKHPETPELRNILQLWPSQPRPAGCRCRNKSVPGRSRRRSVQGVWGRVYLGVHEETGDQAAVKVSAGEPGARRRLRRARFNREIASMKSLDNPHIVKFIDSGTQDETYYLFDGVCRGRHSHQRDLARETNSLGTVRSTTPSRFARH